MGKKVKQEKAPACEAYIERIKVLEKEVEAYRNDGDKLGEQILELRRSVASYKSANTMCRRRIENLKEQMKQQVEHYKGLDIEGDHLYEEALAKIDSMKKTEQGLNDQVLKLTEELTKVRRERSTLEAELFNEKSKPWWKKIF